MLIVSYPVDIEPFLKSLVVTISNLKKYTYLSKTFHSKPFVGSGQENCVVVEGYVYL